MQSASRLSFTCRTAACRPILTTLPFISTTFKKTSCTPSVKALSHQISSLFPRRAVAMPAAVQEAPAGVAAAAAADPKLAKLRELLAAAEGGVDAFIIPSEDPHMSEYPPDCDARRSYISNFDGSAGTAVVTTSAAALWTDGRYFLQAEAQLGKEWTLMKAGTPGVPEIHEWLASSLPANARVAIDPTLHTIEAAEKLRSQLAASGRTLVPLRTNPIDAVWGAERPAPPKAPLRVHALRWAGKSVADKLTEIRADMAREGAGALAVTMLDEVAWVLNLRGGDVSHNPVFLSYAIVTKDAATVFVDDEKVGAEAAAHLKEAGVAVKPYEEAFAEVRALAAQGCRIWMDPGKVSFAMKVAAVEAAAATQAAPAAGARGARKRARSSTASDGDAPAANGAMAPSPVIEKTSPVGTAKAVKNEAELEGFREAHIRDGVALVKFFHWLDTTIAGGGVVTECEVDEKVTGLRAAQPGFVEPSFPTIAGAGPNGAVIHYRPMPDTCRTVDGSTLLLLDSGGQYDCGTTDITRTVHMGTPSAHQKACFTAVLKGHIGLDTAVFPEGTPGCALDTMARTALWRLGLNYRHGTGHGVGAALNVHEGPQSISARFWNTQPLLPMMVCSNEPGYYEDGSFGVRIENLFIVVEADTAFRFAGQPYYTCDRITLCPMQKKMMDVAAMTPEEVAWVDGYHAQVEAAILPRLEADGGTAEEVAWLKEACTPLATASA